MSMKKVLLLVGILIAAAFVLTACAGEPGPAGPQGEPGPAGPQGEPGPALTTADLSCTECHNDTNLISGKMAAWEASLHGSGEAFLEEYNRADCAGCHSGGAFSAMVAAGLAPNAIEAGDTDPTRQDCRTCHQIHTTYTAADWALETTAPVAMFASGSTFDKGSGNLCANCHQARRYIAAATDGLVDVNSRFGPHHGPQSDMLLGLGGAGAVTGSPSAHYSMTENSCVTCHLGEGGNHTFEPTVTACTACHVDAEDFDINGFQTEVEGLLAQLEEALKTAGLLDAEGEIVAGKFPEAQAQALWNYIFIKFEDKSLGVHNSAYTEALLDASLAVFGE